MRSHAFVPTPFVLDADRIRVYVAFLDAERIGRVGWVDVLAEDPTTVAGISKVPALGLGSWARSMTMASRRCASFATARGPSACTTRAGSSSRASATSCSRAPLLVEMVAVPSSAFARS